MLQETSKSEPGINVGLLDTSFSKNENYGPSFHVSRHLIGCPFRIEIILNDPGVFSNDASTNCHCPDNMNDQRKGTPSRIYFFFKDQNVILWNRNCSVLNLDKTLSLKVFKYASLTILSLGCLVLVAGACQILQLYESQQTSEDSTNRVPTQIEPRERHCRQIGTKEACYQNEKCRWLNNRHCCVEDYIASYQFVTGDLMQQQNDAHLKTMYLKYLTKYSKSVSRLDNPIHREIFGNNWRAILAHNKQYENGHKTWFKAINTFSDMTDEEIKTHAGYVGETHRDPDRSTNIPLLPSSSDTPNSLDYRDKGVVTPVKDQGSCASSFAFAAVACMESQYALRDNVTLNLSEQHILDCSKSHERGNSRCQGGTLDATFEFMKRYGVPSESTHLFRYKRDRRCIVGRVPYKNRVTNWKRIEQDEDAMKEALVEHGPIVSSVVVNRDFMSYGGGVFNEPNTNSSNHAVVIVGYGTKNGTDVWIIKNSWGEDWGQEGFMYIVRNENHCNIASDVYAITGVYQPQADAEDCVSAASQMNNFVQTSVNVTILAGLHTFINVIFLKEFISHTFYV